MVSHVWLIGMHVLSLFGSVGCPGHVVPARSDCQFVPVFMDSVCHSVVLDLHVVAPGGCVTGQVVVVFVPWRWLFCSVAGVPGLDEFGFGIGTFALLNVSDQLRWVGLITLHAQFGAASDFLTMDDDEVWILPWPIEFNDAIEETFPKQCRFCRFCSSNASVVGWHVCQGCFVDGLGSPPPSAAQPIASWVVLRLGLGTHVFALFVLMV